MKVAVICVVIMVYVLGDTTGQGTFDIKCGVEELKENVLTRLDDVEGTIATLDEKLDEYKEDVLTRMANVEGKLDTLQVQHHDLTGTIATLDGKLDGHKEEVMTRMDTLEEKMDDLKQLLEQVIANNKAQQWITIQRRGQFGNPTSFFARSMDEYKIGFGNMTGEFWLGLDELARLTKDGKWEMQVDLVDLEGKSYTGIYNKFAVSVGPRYELEVGQYDSSKSTMGYDVFSRHNMMAFSTKDVDQDTWDDDCSKDRGHGGWWYKDCYDINMNGENPGNNQDDWKGMKAYVGKGGTYVMMKETEMKMKQTM